MDLLVELRGIGEGAVVQGLEIGARHIEDRAAESAHPRELVQVREGHVEGLVSAPGEAGHRAVLAVRLHAEGLLDVRDDLVEEDGIEGGAEILHGLPLLGAEAVAAVAVVHHHDHRDALAGGDAVVHDVGHVALLVPAALVLAHAVLQVQHRILLGALLIFGRSIDIAGADRLLDVAPVLALAHLAVRDGRVESVVRGHFRLLGNLDAARLLAAAVEGLAVGVVHADAVHQERIVVEAHHQRVRRAGPDPLLILREGIFLVADVHLYVRRRRRGNLEGGASLGIHAGILLGGDVGGSGCLRKRDKAGGQRQGKGQYLFHLKNFCNVSFR